VGLWRCFRRGLFLGRLGGVLYGVDLEEMVCNDEEHSQRTEKDSKPVEIVVGYHCRYRRVLSG